MLFSLSIGFVSRGLLRNSSQEKAPKTGVETPTETLTYKKGYPKSAGNVNGGAYNFSFPPHLIQKRAIFCDLCHISFLQQSDKVLHGRTVDKRIGR